MRVPACVRAAVAVAALCAGLSIEPAARQPDDVQLKAVGGSGGNRFKTRCPRNQHLLGFKLRAGDDIDAVQAVCGLAYTPTRAEPAVTAMPQLGGAGGNPQGVMCPAEKPVVIGARFEAEGYDTQVLNAIRLHCGVAGPAQATIYPDDGYAAEFAAHVQEGTGGIAVGNFVPRVVDTTMCPQGTVAIGIHGRAGKMVDALGLLCGPAVLTRAPIDAPLGGIAPATTSAVPGPPATIYIRRAGSEVERVVHLGAPDGTRRWVDRRKVYNFDQIAHIHASSEGVIYAVLSNGDLRWNKDPDYYRNGYVLQRGNVVWKDFTAYPKYVIADQGVIYYFDGESLIWNRHDDYKGGTLGVSGRKRLSVTASFQNYTRMFSGGDGVIYAVTHDGQLHWMRHLGHASGNDAPGAVQGALPIGSGWAAYTHVFSAGYGVLYGLTPAGELHWYKFPSHLVGRPPPSRGATLGKRRTVIGPRVVETGLTGVIDIFAMLPGAVDVIR